VVRNQLAQTGSKAEPATVTELVRLASVDDRLRVRKDAKREAVAECRDAASATMRELATVWHREAQRTGERRTYDLARRLYDAWLARYADGKDAYAMRFYQAEVLYALASQPGAQALSCDAAAAYSTVVHADSSPRAKYLRDAAYAAVLSWKRCLDLDDTPRAPARPTATAAEALAPRPIPEPRKKMIAAFQEYVRFVPDSPELPLIQYRLGYTYYELNRCEEAIPWFHAVATEHATTEPAVYAANLEIRLPGDPEAAARPRGCRRRARRGACARGDPRVRGALPRDQGRPPPRRGRRPRARAPLPRRGRPLPHPGRAVPRVPAARRGLLQRRLDFRKRTAWAWRCAHSRS